MRKNIENFNENFSDKDIVLYYENTDKKKFENISKMLDDISLRDKIQVCIESDCVYMKGHIVESIFVREDYTNEILNIEKDGIEKLNKVKEELDKFYKMNSCKLNLSIYPNLTHYNPNNKEILIGLKEQLVDFVILSRYCNPNAEIVGKDAISYLSFLLYHEYYHYLFDKFNLGDSNLIEYELLSKEEIYLKIVGNYKNEKMAWKFAKEWIGDDLDKRIIDTIIDTSMYSYARYSKQSLEELDDPYSDYVKVLGVPLYIKQ